MQFCSCSTCVSVVFFQSNPSPCCNQRLIKVVVPRVLFLGSDLCECTHRCSYVPDKLFLLTEWKQEHFSDVAVLLSKCEDVYSADVPSALQVSILASSIRTLHFLLASPALVTSLLA